MNIYFIVKIVHGLAVRWYLWLFISHSWHWHSSFISCFIDLKKIYIRETISTQSVYNIHIPMYE